jgi:type II secretory pathway pseudopilin PulG
MQKIFKQSGFTILETIISLGIVMIGMIGVASLSRQNISAQNSNRNFLLASVLAQEAVELVRNQRDTNQRNGWDWQTGDGIDPYTDILQDDGFGNDNYTIQYDGEIDPGVNLIDNAVLYITPGGYYVHDNGGGANTLTPFKRLITITDDDNPNFNFIEFNVLVKWSERGNNHNYQVDARLYDWW